MTASNLVVPLVLWGSRPPTHCVASLLVTLDQRHVISGCYDGQICVWAVHDDWKLTARLMLWGHTVAVNCLAHGSSDPEKQHIVSASDNGEMTVWNLEDGRCLEQTKTQNVHTNIQAHLMLGQRDVWLVCTGYYADIQIIHPQTLQLIMTLASRMTPDWISTLCVLRPINREDDVVVAISSSGVVKVWSMAGATGKLTYEDEAKQIRCLNAQMLRCCPYNQRTVLIVCSKYWQIYDAGDFSLLCSESSRRGERWLGGDFIALDKVVVWSSEGRAYLYKLPTNNKTKEEGISVEIASSDVAPEGDRKPANPRSPAQHGPQAYSMLDVFLEKSVECTPVMLYVLARRGIDARILLRGDSAGRIVLWTLPQIHDDKMRLVRQESFEKLPVVSPKTVNSLSELWSKTQPEGIIDHLNQTEDGSLQVTCSAFLAQSGRLVCGRDDGSIIIVDALQALTAFLLDGARPRESVAGQVLRGHEGRVNCVLAPGCEDPRYDENQLLSGGADFNVILWDLASGARLHTYCVHGGEITQLIVPPPNCNSRVLACVASVASDHSLALLSLRERRCVLLAARQLFPIHSVRWRPLDDFLLIACTDGTVFVWQMETGHLDRVVQGSTAEEILSACDEHVEVTTTLSHAINPTISITQALRRANLATFRNFAQQKFQKAQDIFQQQDPTLRSMHHPSLVRLGGGSALAVQGLRTNNRDPHSHLVVVDTEALIVQMLNEEFSTMSPTKLEALGFFVTRPESQSNLTDTQKKVSDFISKVKDHAENIGQKLSAKLENEGIMPSSPGSQRKIGRPPPPRPPTPSIKQAGEGEVAAAESLSACMQTARLLMSCLHAWGHDRDLDALCRRKLGLLAPRAPLVYGLMSRSGHMALSLPGWHTTGTAAPSSLSHAVAESSTSHWQLSSPLTSHHLISLISVQNTLMGMTRATFVSQNATPQSPLSESEPDEVEQAQTKQGWSLLATLHCVLLPDLVGHPHYRAPLLELLARRWQDRCLEIREAAQALLLAELRRIGAEGRKRVVEDWAPFLPSYTADTQQQQSQLASSTSCESSAWPREGAEELELDGDDTLGAQSVRRKQRQATAIVMLGVLGAEFGAELQPSRCKEDGAEKQSVVEGFGLTKYSYSMLTSKALTHLLLQPASPRLPLHTPIRRAAVDLLGRGFTVWEPYLDVSAVLLGLLELCVNGDQLVPSMTFGLPLCPAADACRTARHALSLIATARLPAFIITMAKEVARFNSLAQNAQVQQTSGWQPQQSPLARAKPEILRVIELLVDKIPSDVADLLIEVMDITVHCLDHSAVRARGLQKVFPAICKFNMVSYCPLTRRIAVGSKFGAVAFYELKQTKCQVIEAHGGPVTALSFSADGKNLCSYSFHDKRLLFWQTASSSLFGLGSQSTRVVKTYSAPPVRVPPNTSTLKVARIVWVEPKIVVLLTADGTEYRFRL